MTFKHERKYLISIDTYYTVLKKLKPYMTHDDYNKYTMTHRYRIKPEFMFLNQLF